MQLRLVKRSSVWMSRCFAMHPMELQDFTFMQGHERSMALMRWVRMC